MTLIALLGVLRSLYDEAARTHEDSRGDVGEDIADICRTLATLGAPVPGRPDPAVRSALAWLPTGDAGRLGDIARHALSAVGEMPWQYSYGAQDGLADRIAFADLVGPGGPFVCSHLRLGLTLVAPQTLYPLHAHPARELYCVVSGTALWTAGHISAHRAPGAFVLHRPDVAHAMQTQSEALLAIYSWRGDIMTPPYYTDAV